MTIDILSKTRDWKSKEYYFENLEDNFLFQQIFLYPVNLVSMRYSGTRNILDKKLSNYCQLPFFRQLF